MSDAEEQPLDVGDSRQVRDRRKLLALQERENREALGVLLSGRAGRAWMYRHLEQCHVFESSFDLNPYATAFREGERNVGLRLINEIHEHWPHRYAEMIQEVNDAAVGKQPRTVESSVYRATDRFPNREPGGVNWTADGDDGA